MKLTNPKLVLCAYLDSDFSKLFSPSYDFNDSLSSISISNKSEVLSHSSLDISIYTFEADFFTSCVTDSNLSFFIRKILNSDLLKSGLIPNDFDDSSLNYIFTYPSLKNRIVELNSSKDELDILVLKDLKKVSDDYSRLLTIISNSNIDLEFVKPANDFVHNLKSIYDANISSENDAYFTPNSYAINKGLKEIYTSYFYDKK